MRAQLKPFNQTQEYILATKSTSPDGVLILPRLDGSKLINLPLAQSGNLNYLLFKIPQFNGTEIINFRIQFSETGEFDNTIEDNVYTTLKDVSLFKLFNGSTILNLSEIKFNDSFHGITPEFSTEQLQMDVSEINYQYFRFQWSNDGGITWGRFGYGNRQAGTQIFDYQSSSGTSNFQVSKAPNNAIVEKTDGVFVDNTYIGKINEDENGNFTYDGKVIKGEAKASTLANNAIVEKTDGLFVDKTQFADKDKEHTHNNKTFLDNIDENDIHTHGNKTFLDNLNENDIHIHSNKDVLDGFSQDEYGNLIFNNQSLSEIVYDKNSDYIFTSDQIVDDKLVINNTTPVADVTFYMDSDKNERIVVHLPISVNNTNTTIYFKDVDINDYKFGGVIRFAKGVQIVKISENNEVIYKANNVFGYYPLDADKGTIYQIFNLSGDLHLESSNVLNTVNNQIIKVFVDNRDSNHNVYINNEIVNHKAFFCSFINFNGTVMFFNSVVELG